MRMGLAPWMCLLLVGCGFDGPGGSNSNGDGDGGGDGDGDGDLQCEDWGDRSLFDPCATSAFVEPGPALSLAGDSFTIDTTRGKLVDSEGEEDIGAIVTLDDGVTYLAVVVDGFAIESGAEVFARGSRPLIIASTGELRIAGTLDAGSSFDGRVPIRGAGARDPGECQVLDGPDDVEGGGGAGGAGYGAAGGNGGRSTTTTAAVVFGGLATPLLDVTLAGGCPGGDGGTGDAEEVESAGGSGGLGGGAVVLAGMATIVLEATGVVSANGAGGHGPLGTRRHAGGGGGSGGLLVLDAPTVTTDGLLFANGGGGGGGVNGMDPTTYVNIAGADGRDSVEAASGGFGEGTRIGGFGGSVAGGSEGQTGGNADRGAGGGGGGVGFILLLGDTVEASAATMAESSPAPQMNPALP